jgi:hypothetical protein
MKAFEGFCDRLQVLSHLLHYCLTFNAAICVDWRDENWGQGHRDFSDYFDIVGVNIIQWQDITDTKSIVPACWTMETLRMPMNKSFLGDEYIGPLMKETVKRIEGDIIVSNGRGFRKYHCNTIVKNIRFKPDIVNIMKERLTNFYLPCTVVHLRGTDRYDESTIHKLFEKYNNLMPHSKKRIYIVSDSKKMVDVWLQRFPNGELLHKNSCALKLPAELKCGSHQLSSEILEFYGIDKYSLIAESLTDFMALCYSTDIIGDEKSTFYTMPCFIKQLAPEAIAQMMPGFIPQRKSLL